MAARPRRRPRQRGTLNLLTLCQELRTPKFVLASTSSVYSTGRRPFHEDQPTDRPRSPYAASHRENRDWASRVDLGQ